MKVSELPNDELAKVYIQIRDARAQAKKAFETADDALKEKLGKISAVFLDRFKKDGSEAVRTVYGTAFKATDEFASVGDRDAFMTHVKEQGAYELMDVRCNKTAVKQYIEAHQDVPPGVTWRTEVVVRIHRS